MIFAWIITFVVFMLVIAAMGIGVMLNKKPIAGSCGGLNQLGLKKNCPVCGKKSETSVKKSV